MGPHRAGKTSIKKVIFNKMPPQETIFIKPTTGVTTSTISNSAFVNFEVMEFPGALMEDFPDNDNFNTTTLTQMEQFRRCGAIIYVLDSQEATESYVKEIKKICSIARAIEEAGQSHSISFEVFLHKTEATPDEKKTDMQREVNQRISEALDDMGLSSSVQRCQCTSIYDQSVFECFSKVARKLLPEEGILENLLEMFVMTCKLEKAYMFDMMSKMCVASDTKVCLERHNELCSDMIDIVTDFSEIYGSSNRDEHFDSESFSVIKIDVTGSQKRLNTVLLYLRAVAPNIALVSVITQEDYDGKEGLIDYNFTAFRAGVDQLIQAKLESGARAEDN